MAVLIPIDMPQKCADCPCVYVTEDAFSDYCNVTSDYRDVSLLWVNRPAWCPLVEIKAHKPDDQLLIEAGFEL